MGKKVLGRGLEALIPKSAQGQKAQKEFVYLPMDSIREGKYQPRQHIDTGSVRELSKSIKEKGFIQPIVVRKLEDGFEIVAGARRFQAAKLLGIKEIPTIIKNLNDKDTFMLAIMENLQRKNLNPLEEALAFKRLMDEFNLTLEGVGKALGKDKSSIANTLRLLKLPGEIQEALRKGIIARTQARTILGLATEKEQIDIFHQILKKGLSVRDLEKHVKKVSLKARKSLDPFVVDMEEKFQKALGTKVRIMNKKGNKGKIIIEYYSAGDLERIAKKIL